MKRFIATLLCTFILSSFCSCSTVDKATELIGEIDDFLAADAPTQTTLDLLFAKYDSLSEGDKEKVSNYSKLEKYKGVNIDNVNSLNSQIASVSHTDNFNTLIQIYNSYTRLNAKEKALISIQSIEEQIQLNNLETAAVAACQYIRSSLKSSSSFQLQEVYAINDLAGTSKYYLIKVQYSATNSFGARIDDNSFQTISDDFENPWYGLALLSGNYSSALKCTPFLQYYLLNEQEPTEIDCDKIMYYIDLEVN